MASLPSIVNDKSGWWSAYGVNNFITAIIYNYDVCLAYFYFLNIICLDDYLLIFNGELLFDFNNFSLVVCYNRYSVI